MNEDTISRTWITQETKEDAEEIAKKWHESIEGSGYKLKTVKVYREFWLWGNWVVKMIHTKPQ